MLETGEPFSTREAAAELGISMAKVRGAIKRGELEAEKDESGHWQIDPSSVRRLADHLWEEQERLRRKPFKRR